MFSKPTTKALFFQIIWLLPVIITGLHCANTGKQKSSESADLLNYSSDTSVENSVKREIDSLRDAGKLIVITYSDSNTDSDAHFFLHEGRVVKVERRWKYSSKVEFDLPLPVNIDKIVLVYPDSMGIRTITDANEIDLIYTILIKGSVKTETGKEIMYKTDGYSISNSSKIFEGCKNVPSTLTFYCNNKELLTINIVYEKMQGNSFGEPVVEHVDKYRVCFENDNTRSGFEFENPVLNTIINKYIVSIMQESGVHKSE